MNREYDAADLRYVSAMISNGNSQMWIKMVVFFLNHNISIFG